MQTRFLDVKDSDRGTKISPKTNGESLKIINKQPEIEHFEYIELISLFGRCGPDRKEFMILALLTDARSFCSAHVQICSLLFLSASQINRRRTPPRVKFFSSPRFSYLKRVKGQERARGTRHKKPRKILGEKMFFI
jgi:hypothetical protein